MKAEAPGMSYGASFTTLGARYAVFTHMYTQNIYNIFQGRVKSTLTGQLSIILRRGGIDPAFVQLVGVMPNLQLVGAF